MPQTDVTSPLVGRDRELARLLGVLERARAGEARAVLVAGDAGVGKTRLLDEVAGHAARHGMRVLTGHCVDLGDVGLPYLPFTEILGRIADDERLAPYLAAHSAVERLRGGGGEVRESGPARDADARLRLFDGMAALLARLTEDAPVLMVLEDLHWADQSSRELLRFLLTRGALGAAGHRLAVLVSYRSDDLHRRHPLRPLLAELVRLPAVERLELRPMPDAEMARLLRALRAGPLPDATVRGIVERAEGNAFYAQELLAATDAEAPGVPSALADVLLIRVEQLPDTAQQVLRTAAVAGRRVEHDLLRDAVGLPEEAWEAALREAVGRQLLVPGEKDTYAFRHALTREAVYADLLPGERARLHGRFARLLAGRGDTGGESAAERAHHSRESHDLPEALAASLEAADHARRVGAPAEELRHLEAVLDLWSAVDAADRPAGEGTDRVALTLRASAAAAHAGEAHRAVALTRAALAGIGQDADSELAARVRYTLAGNLLTVDNLTAAFSYSSEALALIPEEPPSRTWVWAAATHVMAARQVGESEAALRVARRALRAAERLGVADARADLLISLVGLEGGSRRTAEGRKRLAEARELARQAGNAPVEMRALFQLALGCFESGAFAESLPWVTEGLQRARDAGLLSSPYPLEMRYLRQLLLYTLGRWDECLRAADGAGAVPAAGGYTVGPALYVALARGDAGAAERARALLDGPFDWMATLVAGIALTDAAALRGDAEAAVEQARATVAALTVDAGTCPDVAVRLAALALSAVADTAAGLRSGGDAAGAGRWERVATELVELARRAAGHSEAGPPQGPEGQAWLARAEAEGIRAVSGPDAAAWEKAVVAFEYGDVYEQARCRLRWAESLLAEDRRAEAAVQAGAVRETAVRLGAAPLLERVEALVRRGRLADASQAGGSPAGSPLTAREQEVLALLARGRSNRQIGEELFITGKTASVHVSNILAKLGAASRTEAVAIAYRDGLLTPEPSTS
ncbi:LuxR family transcriptional regulator [Streptomyces sp. Ru71]|uniref:helix-turn-helix transcriptional regulator n=1 Tax=Streptomyces sp. Ru71 TaxID=2080746 RepID=UPI000CDD86EE|nr:helix-turn-helix transcriptional regulator [Streptomyces sp. Ru71]POX46079.1 LuxR family transcriptional regulator [Streptomyces sp. Ru71]